MEKEIEEIYFDYEVLAWKVINLGLTMGDHSAFESVCQGLNGSQKLKVWNEIFEIKTHSKKRKVEPITI